MGDHHKEGQRSTWEDPFQKGQTAHTSLHGQMASLPRSRYQKLGAAKQRHLLACALPSPPASYLSMWWPARISKECHISSRAISRNTSSTSSPAAAPALWEPATASPVLQKRWWPDSSAFLHARKTRPTDSSQHVSETSWHREHLLTVTWTQTSDHTHQLLSISAIFQAILKQ